MEVVMSVDKDEATQRAEREKEAEAKLQQNIMPDWYAKSTITGELTAVGHQAASRTAASQLSPTSGSNASILESLTIPGGRPAPRAGSSSNAAILSGLGTAPKAPTNTEPGVKVEQDAKPAPTKQSEYYDAYYASLAAPQPAMDAWGAYGGETEDRKPDLGYLQGKDPSFAAPSPITASPAYPAAWNDTPTPAANGNGLNAYGKRPREETLGFGGEAGGEMALAEEVGFVVDGDDPIVYVDGKPMKYSEVTEEHHEHMTADEYDEYYKIFTSREG